MIQREQSINISGVENMSPRTVSCIDASIYRRVIVFAALFILAITVFSGVRYVTQVAGAVTALTSAGVILNTTRADMPSWMEGLFVYRIVANGNGFDSEQFRSCSLLPNISIVEMSDGRLSEGAGVLFSESFPGLNRLFLRRVVLQEGSLLRLSNCVQLERVTISESELSVLNAAALAKCDRLMALNLRGSRLDKGAFSILCATSKVVEVSLRYASIDETEFESLVRMSNLRYLDLSGTKLGDGSLSIVDACPCLKVLTITKGRLTEERITALRTSGVEIRTVQ